MSPRQQKCPYSDGDCAIPDTDAIAIRDGQAQLTSGRELTEDWGIDVESLDTARRLTDEEEQAIADQLEQRRYLIADGTAAQLEPLPGVLGLTARAVIVECTPCGHRLIADV